MAYERWICISLLILVVSVTGCGNNSQNKSPVAYNTEETEPNDGRDKAQPVQHGTILRGFIQKQMDQDWYRLTIPKDSLAVLRADLSSIPAMDIVMKLYNNEGELLLECDKNKADQGERLTNYGVQPGTYYLLVREAWYRDRAKTANDSIPYYLSIYLKPHRIGWELEPNSRGVDATPMLTDTAMSGYLSPANDEDWYRLPLDGHGDDYLEVSLSGLPGVNTRVQVFDPIEAPIHGADHGGQGAAEKISNMGVDIEKEFYYIVVSAKRGESNEDSTYRLVARFLSQQGKMEFEPNNRIVRAMTIADGDTVYGFMDESKDVDWYEIIRPAIGAFIGRVELRGVPDVDFKMTVTDELEEPILVVNEGGEQENEIISNVGLNQAARYFIKIESVNKGANITDRYALSLRLRSPSPTEEFEFNNAPEAANALELERAIAGYIQPIGDVDYYRFTIPNRYLGKLEIVLEGIIKVNTDMVLYDDTMRELAKAARRPTEGIERISFDAFPGTYYIKVYDNDGRESNWRDPYKLAIFVRPE